MKAFFLRALRDSVVNLRKMERDATERFGGRVEYYIKYRPGYPEEVLQFLQQELKLEPGAVIADIGSGTGISSELFLKTRHKVFGVEPNAEMRKAAETHLSRYPNFISIDGKAEVTGLPECSIDLIIAGQAFHWFDRELSKKEFIRILKPSGWVVLLWNDRRQDTSFENSYENVLKTYAIDYHVIDHRLITPETLARFFNSNQCGFKMFDNVQIFDFESLQGRVMSCSYMPMPHQPGFAEMIRALAELFDRFQENGAVTMGYNTLVYYGKVGEE
jgi:SAM-dependent methyltransferase